MKLTILALVSLFYFTSALSQNLISSKCEGENFEEINYFFIDEDGKLSEEELNKRLVAKIFSLISNETKLELTNVNGISSSDFSLISLEKSKGVLINRQK